MSIQITDIVQPERAETVGEEVAEDLEVVLPLLPTDLVTALRTAADVVAQASDGGPKFTTREQARDLLQLLGKSEYLRRQVAAVVSAEPHTPDGPDGIVPELLAADPTVAATGLARARAALDGASRQARASRRREKRSRRGSAEERLEARTLESLATERQRTATWRKKAERLEREVAGLREQLDHVRAGADAEADRAEGINRQLEGLRRQMERPEVTAGWLLGALHAETERERIAAGSPSQDVDLDLLIDTNPGTLTTESGGRKVTVPDGAASALQRLRGTLPGRLVAAGMLEDVASWLPQVLSALANPPAPAVTHERALRVDILGGGTTIGGSCVLIEAADTRILVDCGSRPRGEIASEIAPPGLARALAGPLHAVVVTHAHNDHAGWVPALLRDRPDLPVYATPATGDLLNTMWLDSVRVMARRAGSEYAAPYGSVEVQRAVAALRETNFGQVVRVRDLTLELFAAGHIVGAASVVITAGGKRVVVSGDVSAAGQKTVGGFDVAESALGADLFLLESTYADDREHVARKSAVAEFVREVTRVVDAGGVALVPAFALGRAQEVALVCRQLLPEVPVLIDGLARDVSRVYERHLGPDKRPLEVLGRNVTEVPRGGTDKLASRFRGGVVIATSGMLSQGPVVSWARKVLPDPASSLLVVGYQDEESPGRRLLDLAAGRGSGRFALPNRDGDMEEVDVLAHVQAYKLGAHANANELVTITDRVAAQRMMLVHGEAHAQARLAGRLRSRGRTVVPTHAWVADN